jgi:hypothetical protein
MTQENLEKTNSEISQEEATSAEDTSVDGTTENSEEDIKAKNRQLYERATKAEQKAKEEEAKRLMLEKESGKVAKQATGESLDPSDLAKTVVALKDHSPEEIDYIFKQAKFMNVSPLEAAQNEDVQLFLEAKKERRERSEKTPEPSTKQSPTQKDVSQWTNEDLRNASEREDWDAIDQFRKWAKEQR